MDLAEKGRVDEAIKIAESIRDPDGRDFALLNIVIALSRKGKTRRALEVARKISNGLLYSKSLSEIIFYLELQNRLSEALGIALLIPTEYGGMRVRELLNLSELLIKRKMREEATLAVSEVLKTIRTLQRTSVWRALSTDESFVETISSRLPRVLNQVLRISVDVPRRTIGENETLEVVVRSNIEVEDVMVEFEGLDLKPVRVEKLIEVRLRLKPPFEQGKKRLRVYVSFDILEYEYVFAREFELEFTKSRV